MSSGDNPYRCYVDGFLRLWEDGSQVCPPCATGRPAPPVPGAPMVLVFSPHPDDESINGALPLRLLRECGMNVVNVAVTLGSRRERRAERLKELESACCYLGFGLLVPRGSGLEQVRRRTRSTRAATWDASVATIADVLRTYSPRAVFFPHGADSHPTHIGTHWLLRDALARMPAQFGCHVFETEYWAPMTRPNLLVESDPADVARLVAAVSMHAGEVARNPYHLRMPAWMMDNVRRCGELMSGTGVSAPGFCFATPYRHRRWRRGRLVERPGGSVSLASGDESSRLFSDA